MTNLDNVQQLVEYLVVKNVMVADENGRLPEYVTEEYWSKNKDSMVSSDEYREGSKPTGMTRKSTGKTPMIQIGLKMSGERIIQKNEKDNRAKFYKFFRYIYSRNKVNYESLDDFTQTFLLLFVEACNSIEELEELEVLLGDKKLYNKRIKYIKSIIEERIKDENIKNGNYEKVCVKGENGNVNIMVGLEGYSGLNRNSINDLLPDENGKVVELAELMADENRIYHSKGEAKYNHFLTWFLQNKEEILTKAQLERYNKLKDIYVATATKNKESDRIRREIYEEVGITKQQFNNFKKAIKDRVVKAYEKEFDNFNGHGFTTEDRNLAVEVFKEYVEEADSSTKYFTAEDRQVALSKYVAKYYDGYEEFEIVITKGLSGDEKKEIVRTVLGKQLLSHTVIRKINNNIKAHLETVREVEPAMQEWEGYSELALNGVKAESGNIVSINNYATLINSTKQDRSGVHYDEYRRDTKAGECKVYYFNKETKILTDENSNIVDMTEEMANKLSLLLCENLIQEGDNTNE